MYVVKYFDLELLGLSPQIKYIYWPFQGGTSLVDHLCYLCLVLFMLLRLFIAALWSPDLCRLSYFDTK